MAHKNNSIGKGKDECEPGTANERKLKEYLERSKTDQSAKLNEVLKITKAKSAFIAEGSGVLVFDNQMIENLLAYNYHNGCLK